ncbi:hypothetical protein KKH27_02690 [bacterium]|nr:hypothetical protein [bacterium]MBU1982968.1 hypothetical protein [bacterium]
MSRRRKSTHREESSSEPNVVHVTDLLKQIERTAGIRRKVRNGFYDRPDILAEIARQIRSRLDHAK